MEAGAADLQRRPSPRSQRPVGVAAPHHPGHDVVEPQGHDDADGGDPLGEGREEKRREPSEDSRLEQQREPQQEGVGHEDVRAQAAVHPVPDQVQVEGAEAARQGYAEAQARVGLLLEVHDPAVQDDPLLVHAAVGGADRHAARRAGLRHVLDVAPRLPHVDVDQEVREQGPYRQGAHHEVDRDELAEDREHPPDEDHGAAG
mmetsp:Transcript_60020/g.178675  ORF Transcript_60020/g.178675 Transcript_60020/m.178675 type:complete len:202 (+) Transcript_60020:210-815(+)